MYMHRPEHKQQQKIQKKIYWENVCCHEYVEQAPTEIGYIRFNAYTVYAPVITYIYIKSRKKARTNTMC